MENEMTFTEAVEITEAGVSNEPKKFTKAFLIVTGVGLVSLVGAVVCDKVIKPIIAKIKGRKNGARAVKDINPKDHEGVKVDSEEETTEE